MASSKCVTVILLFAAAASVAGLLGSAAADSSASPVPAVNATDGLALKGYDPVAYFIGGQPTKGARPVQLSMEGRDVSICFRREPANASKPTLKSISHSMAVTVPMRCPWTALPT